jgi:hypothetical protein
MRYKYTPYKLIFGSRMPEVLSDLRTSSGVCEKPNDCIINHLGNRTEYEISHELF